MMRITRRLLALLCALCLLPLTGAAEPASREALQEQIDAISRKYEAVGLSAAYVKDGRLIATFASGWATANRIPMTADTKVRIASVSKVLVGLAAHLLVSEGLITLETPVEDAIGFLLRTRSPEDVVTIRSLLTHTSSLKNQPTASGVYDKVHEILSDPGNFYAARSGSLKSWDYNNFAFYVLGLALEHVSGRTLDQILNAGLCDQLGIDGSFWAGDLKNPELVATIYTPDHTVGLSYDDQVVVHSKGPAANGAVFAGNYHISAADLGKIAAVLASGGKYEGEQALDIQVVRAMRTYIVQQPPQADFHQGFPLRYRENMLGRADMFYHTGSAYGELCLFSFDPVSMDGVVVLSTGAQRNSKDGIYGICAEVAELLYAAGPDLQEANEP